MPFNEGAGFYYFPGEIMVEMIYHFNGVVILLLYCVCTIVRGYALLLPVVIKREPV